MNSAVKDVMTRNVVTIAETAGYKEIVTALRRHRVSGLPVRGTAGRVAGVVSEADLLPKEVGPRPFSGPAKSVLASGRRGERAKAAGLTAADLMSTPAITVSPDASLAKAARLMYERGLKLLPVVDATGRLAGIVSRVDLLSVFTRPDGEIRDQVINDVITGKFALDPNAFEVRVTSGIVTITGHVERAGAAGLIDAVRRVEGVVDVRGEVSDPGDGGEPHGSAMVAIARAALIEAGRPGLATLVHNDKGRPVVDWPAMGRRPTQDDVWLVHAALRRAYEACAPDEIGEGVGQFTDDAQHWYRAILRAG